MEDQKDKNLMRIILTYKPYNCNYYVNQGIIIPKGTRIEKLLKALNALDLTVWHLIDKKFRGKYQTQGELVPNENYFISYANEKLFKKAFKQLEKNPYSIDGLISKVLKPKIQRNHRLIRDMKAFLGQQEELQRLLEERESLGY